MEHHDAVAGIRKPSGNNKPQNHEKDVHTLVSKLQSEEKGIFEVIPGRRHHAFPDLLSVERAANVQERRQTRFPHAIWQASWFYACS